MILLANEIEGQENKYLNTMDVKVERNAFGTQIDSFKIHKAIQRSVIRKYRTCFY